MTEDDPAPATPVTMTADHSGLAVTPRVPEAERYELGDEIARGGGGRVVTARDRRLARDVAVKLPLDTPGSSARLVSEAQLMARLEHPSIVSVHDLVHSEDGTPYYVMKLLDGETLRARIAGASFDARIALLPTLIAVAEAVAYAHHRGIVHRDLKPANVIVGRFGETSVIDWGLAREVATPADDTVAGTPAYMSPEQARGEPVDARTDVYSLGALAYHVLSGLAPYHGDRSSDVVESVISGPPAPLRVLETRVPIELGAIVEKAMARDPAARYRDAGELASDLRRYQAGRLVAAHRYTLRQRLRKWITRRRYVLATGAALAAAAATVFVVWPAQHDPRAMCALAGAPIAAVWSPARRSVFEGQMTAAGAAAQTVRYAGDRLDRYAGELDAAWVEACAATHVRGEQSAELLDRRATCLDDALADLRATLGVIEVPRPNIDRLAGAIERLPDLARCADRDALLDAEALPVNPLARAAALDLRDRSTKAQTLLLAGQLEAGLAAAQDAVAHVRPDSHQRYAVRAHLQYGGALYELGRGAEADAVLQRVLGMAEVARTDDLRASTLVRLANSAIEQEKLDTAEQRVRELESVATRIGDANMQWLRIDAEAELLEVRGDLPGAVRMSREGLAIAERVGNKLDLAADHHNLGSRLVATNHPEEAERELRIALAIEEELLGTTSNRYANTLAMLGTGIAMRGRAAEALELFDRAQRIFDRPDTGAKVDALAVRGNRVFALVGLDRLQEAETEQREVVRITAEMFPAASSRVIRTYQNLAVIQFEQRKLDDSAASFAHAVELSARNKDEGQTIHARALLASVWVEQGRAAAAVPLLEAGVKSAIALEQADLADLQSALAQAYLDTGRRDLALAPALEASKVFEENQDPRLRGNMRLLLARIVRDPARAKALATSARADFVSANKPMLVAKADELLATLR